MRPALVGLVWVPLLLGCSSVAGAPPAVQDAPVRAVAAAAEPPTGFEVEVDSVQTPTTGPDGQPLISWRSEWRLSWTPVAGAQGYGVWFGTNEGAGHAPRRTLDEAVLRLTAAAGTSAPERLAQEQEAGLLFTSSQLLVSIAPRSADGVYGPRSPWFPVGDVPAGGKPIATALTAHAAGH